MLLDNLAFYKNDLFDSTNMQMQDKYSDYFTRKVKIQ